MGYSYSSTDKRNIAWMPTDHSVATLIKLRLIEGTIRGLTPFALDFKYPISAIAGENGTGKSTLLAIAACAYHNAENGYRPTGRKNSYYTFSDFFVQSREEVPPDGIHVRYQFLHNQWRGRESGPGWQTRMKRVGGKWNDYDLRVRRNVVYFGVQRVVPHYERSTHKSYRTRFIKQTLDDQHRQRICAIAGRILGKTYDTFEKHTHSKYSLPLAKSGDVRYSGFNMGAGESAVFEILAALFEAGKGSLLVIDEIELGLHEGAQIRFVNELKELCKEFHCQIICSTHSHVVLTALPPEARFFFETIGNRTVVSNPISPSYACGRLRGSKVGELDIFVEDELAETILLFGLPHGLRQRVSVTPIGSSSAVIRAMATRYLEGKDNCLCVLDGDKRSSRSKDRSLFAAYTEKSKESEPEMMNWIDGRISYLPSDKTPEVWLIDACKRILDKSSLSKTWRVNDDKVVGDWLDEALRESAHREFFAISRASQIPEDQVVVDLVRFLMSSKTTILGDITRQIEGSLNQ